MLILIDYFLRNMLTLFTAACSLFFQKGMPKPCMNRERRQSRSAYILREVKASGGYNC